MNTDCLDNKRKSQSITEMDKNIISLLKQNSRRSVTEMAHILDTSRTNITNRISKLERKGLIKRYTIEVANQILTQATQPQAFFNLQLHGSLNKNVEAFIKNWPDVLGLWSISAAEVDMIILIEAPTHSEIEHLRDKLARHPDIKKIWTTIALKQYSNSV